MVIKQNPSNHHLDRGDILQWMHLPQRLVTTLTLVPISLKVQIRRTCGPQIQKTSDAQNPSIRQIDKRPSINYLINDNEFKGFSIIVSMRGSR